jgi:hypothetical protein
MLAQATPFTETVSALVAALVAAGPVAVAVTKVIDLIRNALDGSRKAPPWLWNVLAFVVGIALCLGWDLNVFGGLLTTVPALSESTALTGTGGDILTGLFVGGMAGFWHDKLAQWSAARKAGETILEMTDTSEVTAPAPVAPMPPEVSASE